MRAHAFYGQALLLYQIATFNLGNQDPRGTNVGRGTHAYVSCTLVVSARPYNLIKEH